MITDLLAETFPISCQHDEDNYRSRQISIQHQKVLLIQPQTFMNCSGFAVEKVMQKYDVSPEHLIVIYDDLDLAQGRLRIRSRGGHGGHKGVKSLIEYLDTNEFIRIRIGIGRPQGEALQSAPSSREDIVDYVLQPFQHEEYTTVKEVMRQAVKAIELIIEGQMAMAMNLYNRS
jgi:PTH1 family peptidyl-tRNA hydrolase